MTAATTANIEKIVRRVLKQELDADEKATLKAIQRVSRLLTDQVIPKLEAPWWTMRTPMPSRHRLVGDRLPAAATVPMTGLGFPRERTERITEVPEAVTQAFEQLYGTLTQERATALATFFTAIGDELRGDEGADDDNGDTEDEDAVADDEGRGRSWLDGHRESEQTPLRSAQRLARLLEEEVLPRLHDRATNGDGISEGGSPDRPEVGPEEDETRPVPAAARQALEALYPQLSADSAAALAALFASGRSWSDRTRTKRRTRRPGETPSPVETRPADGASDPDARSRGSRGCNRGAWRPHCHPPRRSHRPCRQTAARDPQSLSATRRDWRFTDGIRSANDHHGGLMYGGSPTAALDIVAAGPARMRDIAKWLYDHFAGDIVELIHTTPFNTDRGFYVDNQKKYPGGGVFGAERRRNIGTTCTSRARRSWR